MSRLVLCHSHSTYPAPRGGQSQARPATLRCDGEPKAAASEARQHRSRGVSHRLRSIPPGWRVRGGPLSWLQRAVIPRIITDHCKHISRKSSLACIRWRPPLCCDQAPCTAPAVSSIVSSRVCHTPQSRTWRHVPQSQCTAAWFFFPTFARSLTRNSPACRRERARMLRRC